MMHHSSVLDGYLDEDEYALRKVERRALMERTVKVLKIFWAIWARNREMLALQDGE
jgi:hypothetical protein